MVFLASQHTDVFVFSTKKKILGVDIRSGVGGTVDHREPWIFENVLRTIPS